MTLIAFHGDPSLKSQVLSQLAAHRAADELWQGVYWLDGKGCAVGCLTRDPMGGHHRYPELWGIPEHLAWLEDELFERLEEDAALGWPERFMSAVPVGADLSMVWPRWALWLCETELHRHTSDRLVLAVVGEVATAYRRWVETGAVDDIERTGAWREMAMRESRMSYTDRALAQAARWLAEAMGEVGWRGKETVRCVYRAVRASDDCVKRMCDALIELIAAAPPAAR